MITAALVWWDEPVALLEDYVRGVANVADRLVAVDGAYRRYPGGTPRSPAAQARTIRRVCEETNLGCLILIPDRLWAGQVEKRSFCLAAASVGSDWLVIADADHIIHTDRASVQAELGRLSSTVDVISVPFVTPMHPVRSLAKSSATNWHRGIAGRRIALSHIIRALPGLRVEGRHWTYRAIKEGVPVRLSFGMDVQDPAELTIYPLLTPYEVEHRTLLRDNRRLRAGRAFCNDRIIVYERTGQEDDVPGLPSPVFDYTTVPY